MLRYGYLLLISFFIIFSCQQTGQEKVKSTSPRIKKSTQLVSPTTNEEFTRGSEIALNFSSEGASIDSVQVSLADEKIVFNSSSFSVNLPNRKVGIWTIRAKVFFGDKSETHYRKIIVLPENAPQEMAYEVVASFPHDTKDFTQGLLIEDGLLYESTGLNGSSTFKKKVLETGEVLNHVDLDREYFGEGLATINDEFYQLTYQSGIGFVYNEAMEQIRTFNFSGEGYGLTTLGDQLVFTDESEKLYFMEPQSFTVQRQIEAYDNSGKVDSLNELEAINGLIYANIWFRDIVVAIDPATGEVVQNIDFSGLLSEEEAQSANVLNGIAYDPKTKKTYVTGKYWPKLFEVKIETKTIQ